MHRRKVPGKTPSGVYLDDAPVKGGVHSVAVDSPGTVLGDHIQAEGGGGGGGGGGKTNCPSRNSELKPVGLRLEDEGEDDTRDGRSVRLGGIDSSGRECHYHHESQEELQPGSGQILRAVQGSGPD